MWTMPNRPGLGAGVLGLGLLVAGCAGRPPIDTVSGADLAVNQAMNAKAQQYAPEDMQKALDKVSRAKQAMTEEHYDRARRLAEEAQADAQVAEAVARSEEARRMAQEAQTTIDTLRKEAQNRRKGGTDHAP